MYSGFIASVWSFFHSKCADYRVREDASRLCSDKIFDALKTYNIKNVIVMAGTNNLFEKNDRPLMGPIEKSDEIYFLIEGLKFHNFKGSIMALISRRDKSADIK